MKILFLLFFAIICTIFAKDITPISSYYSVGFVSDFAVDKNKLYIANDMGSVDIFDIQTTKMLEQVWLPAITSSMDKIIPTPILSVDYAHEKLLIASVAQSGYREVWLYENHILKKIAAEDKKLSIKEARFLDDQKIVFATLDSEMILYDSLENYNIYRSQISQSAMGDIALSSDKTKIIFCDESGEVKVLDAKSSKTLQSHASQNVDNIFRVAYANGVIITAGQDKRVGVYAPNQKPYHIKSNFLVYCVGISPSGETGVYSSGEDGDLELFDIKTKAKKGRLLGHKGVVNQIKFISENELFSSSRDNIVLRWKLK